MGLFWKRKKSIKPSVLFKIAEYGMWKFSFNGMCMNGYFEIFMFNIWFLIGVFEESNIDCSIVKGEIGDCLKSVSGALSLVGVKDHWNLYFSRVIGWKTDLDGLNESNYPITKQYMPTYIYFHFVIDPLERLSSQNIFDEIIKNTFGDDDFLFYFCEHCNWLVDEALKHKKNENSFL